MPLPFDKPKNIEGRVTLSPSELTKLKTKIWHEQNRNCPRCGRTIWVVSDGELHHKRKRSLGRDDRRENLEVICAGCHRKAHNQ